MNSAAYILLAATFFLLALESVFGDEQVKVPNIINWWERKWVTKKPQTQQFVSAVYYFPFLCSIIFYNEERINTGLQIGEWVSACTILSQNWVVFSVDNMDRPCDNHNAKFNTIRYHHSIFKEDLKVIHGTVYGEPPLDQSRNIKKHVIDLLFYLENWGVQGAEVEFFLDAKADRSNWNISKNFARNVLGGTEVGVGFAHIVGYLVWDAFNLPAPMAAATENELKKKVEEHVKFLEDLTSSQQSCYAGAYNRFTKKMKWFQVMYIPQDECREVYCTYESEACLTFPRKEMHVCFKSLIYGDLCPEDRGTAVYCPDFSHSVLAILTTAPNCGWKNLPNVYTRIDVVANMFGRIWKPSHSAYNRGPKQTWMTYKYPQDLKKYTLMPPGMVRGP